jgi:hypothetical protein
MAMSGLPAVEMYFERDKPVKADIDGDGKDDTFTVKSGDKTDSLVIKSSRFGECGFTFDESANNEHASLLAIDTGNHQYSLCVYNSLSMNSTVSPYDGVVLYGTGGGWEIVGSLSSIWYDFTAGFTDSRTFTVTGETGYSGNFTTNIPGIISGDVTITEPQINRVEYIQNEETLGYDFVFGQNMYFIETTKCVGVGYTQVHIDPETKKIIPVQQWFESF